LQQRVWVSFCDVAGVKLRGALTAAAAAAAAAAVAAAAAWCDSNRQQQNRTGIVRPENRKVVTFPLGYSNCVTPMTQALTLCGRHEHATIAWLHNSASAVALWIVNGTQSERMLAPLSLKKLQAGVTNCAAATAFSLLLQLLWSSAAGVMSATVEAAAALQRPRHA
jgi:hypothetical protein